MPNWDPGHERSQGPQILAKQHLSKEAGDIPRQIPAEKDQSVGNLWEH